MTDIDQLLERLKGPTEIGIARAVYEFVLGDIEDAELAVPALQEVFKSTSDPRIRIDCLVALGSIGGENALKFLSSQNASEDPHVLYGVAVGLAEAGLPKEAAEVYLTLHQSTDENAVRLAKSFATDYALIVRDHALEPNNVQSDIRARASSLSGLPFKDGAWRVKAELPAISRSVVIPIAFANSTARDGPDEMQLRTLATIRKMTAKRWKRICHKVAEWGTEDESDYSSSFDTRPGLVSIVIPRQWEGLEGTFVVIFDSELEPEHGIEAFVMPNGDVIVGLDDGIAMQMYWQQSL
jgi:hypothetical protein